MLKIISRTGEMDISKLRNVYSGSLELSDDKSWGMDDSFYQDTYSFLRQRDSYYCIWQLNDIYVCAARLEPYQEGFLLCGLETAPDCRNRGYAKSLVNALGDYFSPCVIYSHVAVNNAPSLAVHYSCGFGKVKDSAVFLDGSVSTKYVTLKAIK